MIGTILYIAGDLADIFISRDDVDDDNVFFAKALGEIHFSAHIFFIANKTCIKKMYVRVCHFYMKVKSGPLMYF